MTPTDGKSCAVSAKTTGLRARTLTRPRSHPTAASDTAWFVDERVSDGTGITARRSDSSERTRRAARVASPQPAR
jgi:hypothetical protein